MAPQVPALLVQRPGASLWQKYCQQLERRPLLTRSLTGVVGASLGDAIAQTASMNARHSRPAAPAQRGRQLAHQRAHITEQAPVYDVLRTIRMAMYSGLIGAPMTYRWFKVLDKFILPANPTCTAAVLLKTLCDQALYAPVATAVYLSCVRCLEGRPQEAPRTLQQRWQPCLMANYLVWPAAHLINFSLVPSSQRILYVNIVAVFWGAFMSGQVNKCNVEQ